MQASEAPVRMSHLPPNGGMCHGAIQQVSDSMTSALPKDSDATTKHGQRASKDRVLSCILGVFDRKLSLAIAACFAQRDPLQRRALDVILAAGNCPATAGFMLS